MCIRDRSQLDPLVLHHSAPSLLGYFETSASFVPISMSPSSKLSKRGEWLSPKRKYQGIASDCCARSRLGELGSPKRDIFSSNRTSMA
ncbi:hypothetical protein DEO72_LG9g1486 [Vigna unguiculata]|uniref:Uncharacterized protein n=1 Tax=Vigna unguiculata TaxID=3917 RepID=A0A4D6N0R1_VIGUN|nr:hypothetical protein DEO72_LG9g1486 [Vigna unguiculata]